MSTRTSPCPSPRGDRRGPADPRPHRPQRPSAPAGQTGLPGQDLRHPAHLPPVRHHAAGLRHIQGVGGRVEKPQETPAPACPRWSRITPSRTPRPPSACSSGWIRPESGACPRGGGPLYRRGPPAGLGQHRALGHRGEKTTKLVFSGDIGNLNQPILKDPTYLTEADYVVMEST